MLSYQIFFCISQIKRSIEISIFLISTFRTSIYTVFKFQTFMNMSAAMASLGTWIEYINNTKFYTNNFSFSLQLDQQMIKSLCRYRFCQMLVLHHSLYIQIFHCNKAWFLLYYFMDDFIFIILTDLLNALMKFLYLQLLLFYVCRGSSSLTTFLLRLIFTAKAPLLSPKPFL